jgi:hypothetical protein
MVMISKKLQEHISLSRTAAMANKAKGNRYVEILSSLYSDQSRFIEELLQNANDACVRKGFLKGEGNVRFELRDNILFFYHNGILFDEQDLISVTTIGQTTKNGFTDVNLIGKFGLGFKSVFSICHEPEIHSGEYHFRIKDFEVLESTTPADTKGYGTCIALPLKKEEHISEIVAEGLEKITYHHLLFVKGYGTIETETDNTCYSIQSETIATYGNDLNIVRITDSRCDEPEHLLTCSMHNGKMKVAFRVEVNKEITNVKYCALPDQNVSVYFPTLVSTHCGFLIHAEFTTTPTREQIPFEHHKAPENLELLNALSTAFSRLPKILKKNGLLSSGFWTLMPVFTITQDYPISAAVYKGLSKAVDKDAVIPDTTGRFLKLDDLALVPADIAELLNKSDAELLFDKKGIVNQELAEKIFTSVNSTFFTKLKKIDVADFAFAVGNRTKFLQRKNVQWHKKFLHLVSKNNDLWSKSKQNSWFSLREKPFVLLNDKRIAAPFQDGKAAIFHCNTMRKNIPAIHRELLKDIDLTTFFRLLEIPDPDETVLLKRDILPVFRNTDSGLRKNLNAWKKCIQMFQFSDKKTMQLIKEKLSDTACVPVRFTISDKIAYSSPSETYLPEPEVYAFFEGADIPVIHEKLFHFIQQVEIQGTNVFRFFGFRKRPGFVSVSSSERMSEFDEARQKITDSGYTILKETLNDYDIHGLEDFFRAPSLAKSFIIAQIVTDMIPEAEMVFETYTQQFRETVKPVFLKKLNERAWLYDASEQLKKNNDLTSLHHEYSRAGLNIRMLCDIFGLNLIPADISPEEFDLIRSLRSMNKSHEQVKQMIEHFSEPKPELLPEIQSIVPVVIDYSGKHEQKAGITPSAHIQESISFEGLISTHIQHHSLNTAWFDEQPKQRRAVDIVSMLLQKERDELTTIEQPDPSKPNCLHICRNGIPFRRILISGMKTPEGLFLFQLFNQSPNITEVHETFLYAADNVYSEKPVVYCREINYTEHPGFAFGLIYM